MKAELEMRWLGSAKSRDFVDSNPETFLIAGFQEVLAKGKEDKQLIVMREDGKELIRFSIWGENWNALIPKFGNETDLWMGKRIQVLRQLNPTTNKNTYKVVPL